MDEADGSVTMTCVSICDVGSAGDPREETTGEYYTDGSIGIIGMSHSYWLYH